MKRTFLFIYLFKKKNLFLAVHFIRTQSSLKIFKAEGKLNNNFFMNKMAFLLTLKGTLQLLFEYECDSFPKVSLLYMC